MPSIRQLPVLLILAAIVFPVDVRAQVSGYVFSLEDQRPLPDVRIRDCTDSSSNMTAWTNDNGWFELIADHHPSCLLVTSIEGDVEYDLVWKNDESEERIIVSIPTGLDERYANARDAGDVNPKDLTTITGELPAGYVQSASGQPGQVASVFRLLESGVLWLDVERPTSFGDEIEVVLSPDPASAASQFDGRFEFEALDPGLYSLTIKSAGVTILSTEIDIESGLNKATVVLE